MNVDTYDLLHLNHNQMKNIKTEKMETD